MKKERKKYEQKYLSRYKEPKTKKNVGSDLYKPEIPKPKRDMKKERKKYDRNIFHDISSQNERNTNRVSFTV